MSNRLDDITRTVVEWHGISWREYMTWYKAAMAGWARILSPDELGAFISIESMSHLLWLATAD